MEHHHLENTFSTQDILKEKISQKPGNYLISTENQLQGRGRQGSTWEHFECALAFSFNLIPNEVLTLTSLEIGIHLAQFFKGKAQLKWPNDLLNNRKEKVGGILCQLMGDEILVGIGLNLKGAISRPDFPYPIGNILEKQDSLTNNYKKELPIEIYKNIINGRLSSNEVRNQFNHFCIHNQSLVKIINNKDVDEGKFVGISENGEALLDKNGKIKKILTGSLRLA